MKIEIKKNNNSNGFTLVEVMLAVVILMMILIPFLNLFSSGYSANAKAKRITIATALAEEKIEELRSNIYQAPQQEEKQPVEGFNEYQREVLVSPVNGEEDLLLIRVNVYWLEKGTNQNLGLTTYFSER